MTCAICGCRLTAEVAVYSPRSGNHYCRQLVACHRRAQARKEAAAAAS